MMPEETMDQWTGMDTTYGYEIATSPDKTDAVGETLEELFGAEENMYLGSMKENKEYQEQEAFPMKVILYVLAAFLVIFGLINLMNTIMTNLFSRRRELGNPSGGGDDQGTDQAYAEQRNTELCRHVDDLCRSCRRAPGICVSEGGLYGGDCCELSLSVDTGTAVRGGSWRDAVGNDTVRGKNASRRRAW